MLKRFTLILMLSFCAIGVGGTATQQTLDEVLHRHLRAIGGAEAW